MIAVRGRTAPRHEGHRRRFPRWWLNEQASVYVAPGGDAEAPRVYDGEGIRVLAASPRHLLAMKVLAGRPPPGRPTRLAGPAG